MFPLGFVFGAMTGVAALVLFRPQVIQYARPVAKTVLKAALSAAHEAQVQGAEIVEAAEDLYAEAKSEVTAEVFAAAMAEAQAKAAEAQAKARAAAEQPVAPEQTSPTKAARKRASVKRSKAAGA